MQFGHAFCCFMRGPDTAEILIDNSPVLWHLEFNRAAGLFSSCSAIRVLGFRSHFSGPLRAKPPEGNDLDERA
jgi:hypothetical protein